MSDQEFEVEALGVEVSAQPIELYKVLKIANAVNGGGEAKFVIAEGYVAVNGELEQRKRRKVYDGDVIEFNQEYYVVICDQPVSEEPVVKSQKPAQPQKSNKASKSQSSKPAKGNKSGKAKKAKQGSSGPADSATGRKPLLF